MTSCGPGNPRFQPGQSIDYLSASYDMWLRGTIVDVKGGEVTFNFFKPGFFPNNDVETRTGPIDNDALMELEKYDYAIGDVVQFVDGILGDWSIGRVSSNQPMKIIQKDGREIPITGPNWRKKVRYAQRFSKKSEIVIYSRTAKGWIDAQIVSVAKQTSNKRGICRGDFTVGYAGGASKQMSQISDYVRAMEQRIYKMGQPVEVFVEKSKKWHRGAVTGEMLKEGKKFLTVQPGEPGGKYKVVELQEMSNRLRPAYSDWEVGDQCEIKIDGKWVSSIIAGTPNLIYDVRTEDGMRFQKFFPSDLRWPKGIFIPDRSPPKGDLNALPQAPRADDVHRGPARPPDAAPPDMDMPREAPPDMDMPREAPPPLAGPASLEPPPPAASVPQFDFIEPPRARPSSEEIKSKGNNEGTDDSLPTLDITKDMHVNVGKCTLRNTFGFVGQLSHALWEINPAFMLQSLMLEAVLATFCGVTQQVFECWSPWNRGTVGQNVAWAMQWVACAVTTTFCPAEQPKTVKEIAQDIVRAVQMRFWELVYEPVRLTNQFLDVCLRGAIEQGKFWGTGLEIGINVNLIVLEGAISFGAVIDKNGMYNLYIAFGTALGGIGDILMPSVKAEIGFFPMITVQNADDMHGWGTGHSLGIAANFGPPPAGITVTFSLEAGFACAGPADSLAAALSNFFPAADLTGILGFIFQFLTQVAAGTGMHAGMSQFTDLVKDLDAPAQKAIGRMANPRCNFENTGPKIQFGAGLSMSPLTPSYSSSGVWALGMNVVLFKNGESPSFDESMKALQNYFNQNFPDMVQKKDRGILRADIKMPDKMGLKQCSEYADEIDWLKWNDPEQKKLRAERVKANPQFKDLLPQDLFNCDIDTPDHCVLIGIPFSRCTETKRRMRSRITRCKCDPGYVTLKGQICTVCSDEAKTSQELQKQNAYWRNQVEEVYGGRDLLNPRSGKLDPQTGKEEIPRQILEQAGEMGLTGAELEAARYRKARGHGQFSENPRFKKFDPHILIYDEQITLADVLEDLRKQTESDLERFNELEGIQVEDREMGRINPRKTADPMDDDIKALKEFQEKKGYTQEWFERERDKREERKLVHADYLEKVGEKRKAEDPKLQGAKDKASQNQALLREALEAGRQRSEQFVSAESVENSDLTKDIISIFFVAFIVIIFTKNCRKRSSLDTEPLLAS